MSIKTTHPFVLLCRLGLLGLLGASCGGSCGESAKAPAPQAKQTAESITTAEPSPAAPAAPGAVETCSQCEERQCRNYRKLGIDLVGMCTQNPDTVFAKACVKVVECGRRTKCAFSHRGPEECYCGTAKTMDCAKGIGIDGPCKAEMEAAAGNSNYEFITTNFGERSLALGSAVQLLECDHDFCPDACIKFK